MILEAETFTSLLRDRAHWEFELFLIALFDIFLGGLCWPFIKRHWGHHVDRDKRDGVWGRPESSMAICTCGKPILNITNPKFHGKQEYWKDGDGFVCVDNHWHTPRRQPETEHYTVLEC